MLFGEKSFKIRCMDYKRPLHADILRVYSQDYPVLQAIVGPRQVGKTTLAKQFMADLDIPSVYASADAPIPPGPEWIETQWHLALRKAAETGKVLLVLDEVQKVRGWSETLKALWDNRASPGPGIKVLLLGSSSLLVQKGLTESLSGRFFLHYCPHWSFPEMKAAFGWDLDRWILMGGYPGSVPFAGNEEHWKAYITDSLIETVLNKDSRPSAHPQPFKTLTRPGSTMARLPLNRFTMSSC